MSRNGGRHGLPRRRTRSDNESQLLVLFVGTNLILPIGEPPQVCDLIFTGMYSSSAVLPYLQRTSK